LLLYGNNDFNSCVNLEADPSWCVWKQTDLETALIHCNRFVLWLQHVNSNFLVNSQTDEMSSGIILGNWLLSLWNLWRNREFQSWNSIHQFQAVIMYGAVTPTLRGFVSWLYIRVLEFCSYDRRNRTHSLKGFGKL
jgi:hypothetical protein